MPDGGGIKSRKQGRKRIPNSCLFFYLFWLKFTFHSCKYPSCAEHLLNLRRKKSWGKWTLALDLASSQLNSGRMDSIQRFKTCRCRNGIRQGRARTQREFWKSFVKEMMSSSLKSSTTSRKGELHLFLLKTQLPASLSVRLKVQLLEFTY